MNTIIKGVRSHNRKTGQEVVFDVDVEIDLRKLGEEMGRKAYANKSGKSTEVSGLIKVSVRGGSK